MTSNLHFSKFQTGFYSFVEHFFTTFLVLSFIIFLHTANSYKHKLKIKMNTF